MRTDQQITLGLDVGARMIGVSVFRGEQLVFYAVKTFRKYNHEESLKNLEDIIQGLIEEYKIRFIAIEKIVFIQQHRSFVKVVYDRVIDFLKDKNIRFKEYNPKFVRQSICGLEKPTKRNAALILAQNYAELVRYFNVPKLWQKRYYAQLFDAIAVGLVCAREFRRGEDQ